MRQRNEKGIFIEIPDDEKLRSVTIRLTNQQLAKVKKAAKSKELNYNQFIRDFIDKLPD